MKYFFIFGLAAILFSSDLHAERIGVYSREGLLRAYRESSEGSLHTVKVKVCDEFGKSFRKLELLPSSGLSMSRFKPIVGDDSLLFVDVAGGDYILSHSKRWDACIEEIEISVQGKNL